MSKLIKIGQAYDLYNILSTIRVKSIEDEDLRKKVIKTFLKLSSDTQHLSRLIDNYRVKCQELAQKDPKADLTQLNEFVLIEEELKREVTIDSYTPTEAHTLSEMNIELTLKGIETVYNVLVECISENQDNPPEIIK